MIPLAGVAAALLLPIIQGYYAAAITALYAQAPAAVKQPEPAVGGVVLSPADQEVLHATLAAIDTGVLAPAPSGNAIYTRVMGSRGDRGRASRVRTALAHYRPNNPTGGEQ